MHKQLNDFEDRLNSFERSLEPLIRKVFAKEALKPIEQNPAKPGQLPPASSVPVVTVAPPTPRPSDPVDGSAGQGNGPSVIVSPPSAKKGSPTALEFEKESTFLTEPGPATEEARSTYQAGVLPWKDRLIQRYKNIVGIHFLCNHSHSFGKMFSIIAHL